MRRRVLITIAATAALLLVAAVSLAAWLSLKETEPSTFAAGSASNHVDLGTAEGTAMFTMSGMQPGEFSEACFRARIDLATDMVSPATNARLYSGAVGGTGLADYLTIDIVREAPVGVSLLGPGIIPCTEVTGTLSTMNPPGQLLVNYGTTFYDYAHGVTLGSMLASSFNTVDIKIVMTLPSDAPTEAAGLTASTSWIVEDQ